MSIVDHIDLHLAAMTLLGVVFFGLGPSSLVGLAATWIAAQCYILVRARSWSMRAQRVAVNEVLVSGLCLAAAFAMS